MRKLLTALSFVLAGAFSPVSAQTVDPNMLIQTLAPERAGPIVRSLREQGAISLTPDQPLPPGLDLPTVDVRVDFAEGGHLLSTAGMMDLRSVAMALNAPQLAQSRFQVAGHYFNLSAPASALPVSYRRAAAVTEHLIAFYGVDPARLVPVGYGQTKPSDPGDYQSPLNSRIELINIDTLN